MARNSANGKMTSSFARKPYVQILNPRRPVHSDQRAEQRLAHHNHRLSIFNHSFAFILLCNTNDLSIPSPLLANTMSRSRTRTASVPDLLSFDSWDYDAGSTLMSSTTNSFDTGATILSAAPSHDEDDVCIQVSGASFNVNPAIFRQLSKLPWSVDAKTGVYSLGTSPDHFEILLNYILFESLPDKKLLSSSDSEELETMVIILGLNGLQQHLEKDTKKNLLRSRSFRRQPNKQQAEKQQTSQNPYHRRRELQRQDSAPAALVSSTKTEKSPVKEESTASDAPAKNGGKGLVGRLAKAVAARRSSQQAVKVTHAQWCASDVVD